MFVLARSVQSREACLQMFKASVLTPSSPIQMTSDSLRTYLSQRSPTRRAFDLSASPFSSSLILPSRRFLSSSPLSRLSSAAEPPRDTTTPPPNDQPKTPANTRWQDDPDDLFSLAPDDPNKPKTFRTQARDATYSVVGSLGWVVALMVFIGGVWAVVGWNSPSALAKKARKRIESFPVLNSRLDRCTMRASSTRARSRYHVTERTDKRGVNYHELSFALIDTELVCNVVVVYKESPGLIPYLPQLDIDFLEVTINEEERHILVVNGQGQYQQFLKQKNKRTKEHKERE